MGRVLKKPDTAGLKARAPCPALTPLSPEQTRAAAGDTLCSGPALTDQQSSSDADVVFQILGFKKPPGYLTGTIKNVSLRAAACHKKTTGQGHKNPVPATPPPVASGSARGMGSSGGAPPTRVCVHVCVQVGTRGGVCAVAHLHG